MPPVRLRMDEARGLPGMLLQAEKAVGRVSGELVWAYPPGVPLLAPGEEVTAPLLAALREMTGHGVALHAERGNPPKTLWVVKNSGT